MTIKYVYKDWYGGLQKVGGKSYIAFAKTREKVIGAIYRQVLEDKGLIIDIRDLK